MTERELNDGRYVCFSKTPPSVELTLILFTLTLAYAGLRQIGHFGENVSAGKP